ncbi:2-oxoglutarate dehydrogenase subunit E1 [bacterium]|nr:2-oxoglutarate dehydrogenase subunit E1 [bacterium]
MNTTDDIDSTGTASLAFLEELFEQYRVDPAGVPADWRAYFAALDAADGAARPVPTPNGHVRAPAMPRITVVPAQPPHAKLVTPDGIATGHAVASPPGNQHLDARRTLSGHRLGRGLWTKTRVFGPRRPLAAGPTRRVFRLQEADRVGGRAAPLRVPGSTVRRVRQGVCREGRPDDGRRGCCTVGRSPCRDPARTSSAASTQAGAVCPARTGCFPRLRAARRLRFGCGRYPQSRKAKHGHSR